MIRRGLMLRRLRGGGGDSAPHFRLWLDPFADAIRHRLFRPNDGSDSLAGAIERIVDRNMADNPIATLRQDMFHFEYRAYPEVALRESLMNAFCHADFRLAAPIMVKKFSDKLETINPGGFIGGISSENILHHPPISRNPTWSIQGDANLD